MYIGILSLSFSRLSFSFTFSSLSVARSLSHVLSLYLSLLSHCFSLCLCRSLSLDIFMCHAHARARYLPFKPFLSFFLFLSCSLLSLSPFSVYTNGRKMTSFRGTWQSWELAWTMNWVDRLRTSADKRMWSGRRAVVMRTGRRAELVGVKLGCPRSRCRAVVSDVLCVRSCVHFVCVCVYMCTCVCVRT